MSPYRNSITLGLVGVVLIIVGMAVQALIPVLAGIGAFVVGVGWVLIAIAVIIFIIDLIRGAV